MSEWIDGLPENNHPSGVWESSRIDCPECGCSAFENAFHVWCDECRVYRETQPDGA